MPARLPPLGEAALSTAWNSQLPPLDGSAQPKWGANFVELGTLEYTEKTAAVADPLAARRLFADEKVQLVAAMAPVSKACCFGILSNYMFSPGRSKRLEACIPQVPTGLSQGPLLEHLITSWQLVAAWSVGSTASSGSAAH